MKRLLMVSVAIFLLSVPGTAQTTGQSTAAENSNSGRAPQTGAQALARRDSLADQGALTVDVTAYGASPSNADNFSAIQAATAFVNTQPAASVTLVFPPGNYYVNPLDSKPGNFLANITANHVTVTGYGATIAISPGDSMGQRWGVSSGATFYWNYFVLRGSHDTIEGLNFDSNGMTSWSAGCKGIYGCWWATGVYVVKGGRGPVPTDDWVVHNRFLQLYGWATLSAGNNTRIEGNYAEDSAGMVCQSLVPSGESTGCDISDNISVDSIDAPYAVNGGSIAGSAVTNFRIENNYASGNRNGAGIDVTAATDGVVSGNVITGMKNWCIQVDRTHGSYRPQPAEFMASQRIKVSGNYCNRNNGYAGWPLDAEIMIGDNYAAPSTGPDYKPGQTAKDIMVSDNMVTAQNALGLGIAVGYGASNVTVTGNEITGCGNGSMTPCNTGSVFRYVDTPATSDIVLTNNHQDTTYTGVLRTNGRGPYEIWGNGISTVGTGSPATQAASASPVAGLRAVSQPAVISCGAATICSNNLQANAFIQWGVVTLTAGSATVTGLHSYTSTANFGCIGTDTTAPNYVRVVPASATSVMITGTGTDAISWECHGN
jgi:hypothetical protein